MPIVLNLFRPPVYFVSSFQSRIPSLWCHPRRASAKCICCCPKAPCGSMDNRGASGRACAGLPVQAEHLCLPEKGRSPWVKGVGVWAGKGRDVWILGCCGNGRKGLCHILSCPSSRASWRSSDLCLLLQLASGPNGANLQPVVQCGKTELTRDCPLRSRSSNIPNGFSIQFTDWLSLEAVYLCARRLPTSCQNRL